MLRKNEIYRAEITDYTTEGSGICRIDGIAVFVQNAAVGDIADIRIIKPAKNYAFGKIESIIDSSPDRIAADCPVCDKCGGCSFRHITYDSELLFKQKRVTDALTRIGGLEKEITEPIEAADGSSRYRNKAQLPIAYDKNGSVCVGFYAMHSHRVIPLEDCLLHTELFTKAAKVFLEWANKYAVPPYDEAAHKGILRHLYLRQAQKTNELMVCIVANAKELRRERELVTSLCDALPELKTVVLNTNTDRTNVITGRLNRTLYGDGYITDELCSLRFRISPLSFYQVNRDQAEKLYGIASEFADINDSDVLLDLYCGTGTIGLTMAKKAKKLIGVEIIPQAIEDARLNASLNGITNAEFICSDASDAAHELNKRHLRPDCIILDPPRKGCDRALIGTVSQMDPKRIVYVSCDPATLARDIKLFSELGFTVQRVKPVDMFPRTGHVETVVLMKRT